MKKFLSRAHFVLTGSALGVSACAGGASSSLPTGGASAAKMRRDAAKAAAATPTPVETGLGSDVNITLNATSSTITYNGETLVTMSYASQVLTVNCQGNVSTYAGPTPMPTATPTPTPTPKPTPTPTPKPTPTPTPVPTAKPTLEPTTIPKPTPPHICTVHGICTETASVERISQTGREAHYRDRAGNHFAAKPSKDGGLLISTKLLGGGVMSGHVRPNGAIYIAFSKAGLPRPLVLKFKPNAYKILNGKSTQRFTLSKVKSNVFSRRNNPSVPTRAALLRGAIAEDESSGGITLSSVSTAPSSVSSSSSPAPSPTASLPVIATVSNAPQNTPTPPDDEPTPVQPTPVPTQPGGGGSAPSPASCLTSAVIEFSDEVAGGAATVKLGAEITTFVDEILAAGTIDAAAIGAAALGSGLAAVFIVGGLFVIGVSFYAIYQDYQSCMNGNG